jgi:hypothetical protein
MSSSPNSSGPVRGRRAVLDRLPRDAQPTLNLALGLPAAAASSKALDSLLVGVAAYDPAT